MINGGAALASMLEFATRHADLPVGAYVEPLIFAPGATTGERRVVRVTARYESSPGHAYAFDVVDASGRAHRVARADDPRPADAEQIAEFLRAESGAAAFNRAWDEAFGDAAQARMHAVQQRADDLMLQAARGGPFWGVDKERAGAAVRGLGEFVDPLVQVVESWHVPPGTPRHAVAVENGPDMDRDRDEALFARAAAGLPVLDVLKMFVVPDLTSAMDDLAAETTRIARDVRAPMEVACRYVMALGYTPADCLIEHHAPTATKLGEEHRSREVLVVRGVPAFEVTTVQKLDANALTFTVEPRVLTWPDPIPSPEPQSQLVARDG